jgi:tRNA(fMet)-specific endonuclease VapC
VNPPFLLDTNTCIAYLRKRNASVINRIQARSPDELRLCSVVVAELYFGSVQIAAARQELFAAGNIPASVLELAV